MEETLLEKQNNEANKVPEYTHTNVDDLIAVAFMCAVFLAIVFYGIIGV